MKKVGIGIAAIALVAMANAPAVLSRHFVHREPVAIASTTTHSSTSGKAGV